MTAEGAPAAGQPDGYGPTGSVVTGAPGPTPLPRSALLAAVPAMGRTVRAAVPAIVLTAAVQAVLMYLDVQSGFSVAFLASFAVSALVTLLLYAVLSACALEAADHRTAASDPGAPAARPEEGGDPASARSRAPGGVPPSTAAARRARTNAGPFVAWIAIQWLAIVLVSLVSPWLIAVVAALTAFLPLAAIDRSPAALLVNFQVIGQRFGRWLPTSLVLMLLGLVLFLLSVANTLFVQGTPAAIIFWLAIGLVAWWVLTAWALMYRSCPAGAPVR